MRAIQVQEFGGPEVLELREVPDPEPADGLVRVEVSAAGVNYADTHQAENSYLQPATLPLIPGGEVVGTSADGAIDTGADDLKGAIQEAAGGKVDVVPEMVGGSTFEASMSALAPFGRLVTYGMASREIPKPIDPVALSRRGHGVIGFWLVH